MPMTKRKRKPQQEKHSSNKSTSIWRTDLYFILGLLLLTFAVFYNTTNNGFVNWDDDKNFYENIHITSLGSESFWVLTKEIFSSTVIGNYNPLSIWSFLIDMKLFGLEDPAGWHLINILLHLIGVLLVYLIGRKLKLDSIPSLFFALLFAIHPMRVESVAWVTERKDVLFGAFYLGALYHYLKYKIDKNKKSLKWIYLLFVLSLLSKIQAVALPLSMIAIDYYLDGRFDLKSILKKWPFFLLSLITGLVGVFLLKEQGSIDSNSGNFDWWQRIFIGSYSYVVYVIKSIFPYRMSPMYPYPSQIPTLFYVSFLIVPLLAWIMLKWYQKGYRSLVFGTLFFTFNIVFLLQVLGAGQGFLADRFSYISYIGLNFVLAFYFQRIIENSKFRKIGLALAFIMIVVYSGMSYAQNQIWKNSGTLWSHVLKYYTKTKLPYGNRANYYRDEGRLKDALSDYNNAISIGEKSNDLSGLSQTFNSRARLYFDSSSRRDTLQLALKDYTKAIELNPETAEFYSNRGATYARLGDMQNALSDLTKSIEIDPNRSVSYMNRSLIYQSFSQWDMVVEDLESYVRLNPYNANIWYELGKARLNVNNAIDGLKAFDKAIEINSNNGLFYYMRAKNRAVLNNRSGAAEDVRMSESLGFKNVEPAFKADLGM